MKYVLVAITGDSFVLNHLASAPPECPVNKVVTVNNRLGLPASVTATEIYAELLCTQADIWREEGGYPAPEVPEVK